MLADDNAPIFYGEWPLEKILKHYPNGEEIHRAVFDAVTSAVHTFVRKANRQIRTTKEVFNLPQAGGVLVVVNDLVEVLSPEVLAFKIGELFRKRTSSGELQFPDIEGVWIFSETHLVEVSHGVKAIPAVILFRDDQSAAARAIDEMSREWAQVHGMPYLEMNPELSGTVRFESSMQPEHQKEKLRRQELWELQYRHQPYLRRHSEEELKHYFGLVMRGLAPGLLKGANTADRELSFGLLERWTHLLQEIRERGIDMRSFSPGMQALGSQIKRGELPRTTLAEIEAVGRQTVTMEVRRYYTNYLNKSYRCVRVQGDIATLVLLDQLMGKTLEVVMKVNRPNWHFYWPLLDTKLIAALDQRFTRIRERHPEIEPQP